MAVSRRTPLCELDSNAQAADGGACKRIHEAASEKRAERKLRRPQSVAEKMASKPDLKIESRPFRQQQRSSRPRLAVDAPLKRRRAQVILTPSQAGAPIIKKNPTTSKPAVATQPRPSTMACKKLLTPSEMREQLRKAKIELKDLKENQTTNKVCFSELQSSYEQAQSRLNETEEKLNSIEAAWNNRSSDWAVERCQLQHTNTTLVLQLECLQNEKRKLFDDVNSKNEALALSQYLTAQQKAQIGELEDSLKVSKLTMVDQAKTIERLRECIAHLENKSRREEAVRRELHNSLQELKGNIRVFCRVRPPTTGEGCGVFEFSDDDVDERKIALLGRNETSFDGSSASQKRYEYDFDRVFRSHHQQDDLFCELKQLVQSSLDGYHVVVLAYGQTGAGKTFTMTGTSSKPGMIPLSVGHLFQRIGEMKEKEWTYRCQMSVLEIHNEKIIDLLRPTSNNQDVTETCEHKIQHDKSNGITTVSGIEIHAVASPSDVYPLLERASSNRSIGETSMNIESSRSHSVFRLEITGHNAISGSKTNGVLSLVDLAGSERLKQSNSTGERLTETKSINKSLSCLGDVIAALSNGSKHIPFRNSKLTYLLQQSFGPSSKCLMLVNLSPEEEHMNESMCSLRFASKVSACHIGSARRHIKFDTK